MRISDWSSDVCSSDLLFLQSSNAIVGHRLFERFDASRPGDPPRVLDQHNRTRMLVSETRLSRPFHDGLGWVVGASIVDNRTRQQRAYGAASLQAPLTAVTNRIHEMTGYRWATLDTLPQLRSK